MESSSSETWGASPIKTDEITARDRYQLLTSLVVPRPIGWLSSFSAEGRANLAPFSYFAALADTPMLVGASIGQRSGGPKDTLRNIREMKAFCVNVVTEGLLEAMNASAGDYPPEVDEFEVTGLPMARASRVDAPYVGNCPAVLECRLYREVELGSSFNRLVIGEVLAVHIDPHLERVPGSYHVATESLRPVGRLYSGAYGLLGPIKVLTRPRVG